MKVESLSSGVGESPLVRPEPTDSGLAVAFVGDGADWLSWDEARATLRDLEVVAATSMTSADVIHVGPRAAAEIPRLRSNSPESAVVLDLTSRDEALPTPTTASHADSILLGSLRALRAFRTERPSLADRTALARVPVELNRHAPLTALRRQRPRELHALEATGTAPWPPVLFAGPLTKTGGLDLAIEAQACARRHVPSLALAAIPCGPVDEDYAARCVTLAEELGCPLSIATGPPPASVLPFWYALASLVVLPSRGDVTATPARLAAAAGRPFVGSEVESLREHVADGRTGFLVPVGDVDTLAAAIEALTGDREEAERLGTAARLRAEEELSPEAAARRLAGLWSDAVRDHRSRSETRDEHF